ncbi:SpoIIE family protein phosphatase [Aurantibacillus circumpalustris]|uniref:SpoIIE family protein phosphatase n=1 Tax=Aurantibacillus circumpalustris TaxID=3036359 RepID=UPI00295BDB83|nr:SpoIIE family protein phosphatase [Aurantibacillus circumpalustris]
MLCKLSLYGQVKSIDAIINQKVKETNKRIDSMLLAVKAASHDSIKLRLYNSICEICHSDDVIKYATPMLEMTNRLLSTIKDTVQRKELLHYKASALVSFCEGRIGNDKSLEYSQQALTTYEELKDWENIIRTRVAIANMYKDQGNIIMQLECLQEGLQIAKKADYKKGMSQFLVQIMFLYAAQGDTAQALNYLEKASVLEKEINDSTRWARGYFLIGKFYAGIFHFDKAIEYYNKSIERYEKEQNKNALPQIYMKKADVYVEKHDYILALQNAEKANRLAEEADDFRTIFWSLVTKGEIYAMQNDYVNALKIHLSTLKIVERLGAEDPIAIICGMLANDYFGQKNYAQAKLYSDRSLQIMIKNNAGAQNLMKSEKLAYRIDSTTKDFKGAFLHYQNFKKLDAKLNNEDVHKAAAREKFQSDLEMQKMMGQMTQEKQEMKYNEDKKKQRIILYSVSLGLLLLLLLVVFIFRGLRQKQKANKELLQKNEVIVQQKHLVEEKQKEITDSITYAKRLQEAILPPKEFVNKHVPDNFILYRPKDIVAGDFYWAECVGSKFFIAAADSTGHGVPGAMVSVVCSNALNRSVKEFGLRETGKILDKTRELVIETFEKSTSEVKDGMDISLLCIDRQNQKVYWSGANNPLWYIQNNELKEIKADKQPIGKTDHAKPFTTHELEYKENTIFYLFTDGLADQFGGPNGKKFKYKQFSDLLLQHSNLDPEQQTLLIDKVFSEWKGELEQVDDVCVIGIKI